MSQRIDVYLDCASTYSWIALAHLRKQRPLLDSYNVTVEFHPVFLGAILQATKNSPPVSVAAKGHYLGKYDMRRTFESHGLIEHYTTPSFFPVKSLSALRCLTSIKAKYDREKYEEVFGQTWEWIFGKQINLGEPEELRRFLLEQFDGNEKEVDEILRSSVTPENKEALIKTTESAIEKGAYGNPWLWVTNAQGKGEPVFGSDRWQMVYRLLDIPFEDVRILPPARKGIAML